MPPKDDDAARKIQALMRARARVQALTPAQAQALALGNAVRSAVTRPSQLGARGFHYLRPGQHPPAKDGPPHGAMVTTRVPAAMPSASSTAAPVSSSAPGPLPEPVQTVFYNARGEQELHVDHLDHGTGAPSGHYHRLAKPGVPGTAHPPGSTVHRKPTTGPDVLFHLDLTQVSPPAVPHGHIKGALPSAAKALGKRTRESFGALVVRTNPSLTVPAASAPDHTRLPAARAAYRAGLDIPRPRAPLPVPPMASSSSDFPPRAPSAHVPPAAIAAPPASSSDPRRAPPPAHAAADESSSGSDVEETRARSASHSPPPGPRRNV